MGSNRKLYNADRKFFYALVQAGLWGREIQHCSFEKVDYNKIYKLAEEQSVVGIVAAGIEFVTDVKTPSDAALLFAGSALQIESQNKAMNKFLAALVEKMRAAGIYTLLIKGQGIAQCYERPLWRSCGDVDLLLSNVDYKKALNYLRPLATHVDNEDQYSIHLAMMIEAWEVELHGSLRGGLWKSIDGELDKVQNNIINNGCSRTWMNGETQIILPRADEDIVYVFAHILQHFYKEGVGLRQICDWCRLIWTYREKINVVLLEKHLRCMGVMTEWKAFSAFAVEYLGMPIDSMPFYNPSRKWVKKAKIIEEFMLETGNLGHNRDYSYHQKYSYVVYKAISLWKHTKDIIRYFFVFPMDSTKVCWSMVKEGVTAVFQGK